MSTLASFLPGTLRHRLAERALAPVSWSAEPSELVAMGIDVSGFTELTERMAATAVGAEEVVGLLDRYFVRLVESIDQHGGLPITFGGDSVVAVWPAVDDASLADLIRLAAAAGLAAQRQVEELSGETHRLGIKIGIGAGPAFLLDVGGAGGRWYHTVGGRAPADMGRALQLAAPGRVILSPSAAEALRGKALLVPVAGGGAEVARLEGETLRPAAHELRLSADDAVLEVYLPAQLPDRLRSGELRWLAEHRSITSVFANLPLLDLADERDRNALQFIVRTAQEAFARFEGTLTNVLIDEKGATLVGAFGLPPLAHEEDPLRAIAAGQEINRLLLDLRLDHAVGIATGRCYCGVYGSDVYRQYTAIGSSVNLAARLMQAGHNEVLCDGVTMRSTRRRIHFSELEPIRLKGHAEPTPVFRPTWAEPGEPFVPVGPGPSGPLVAREEERARLAARLGWLTAGGSPAAVVVTGEAGIGKSALVTDTLAVAQSLGVRALYGAADPVENAPYHAWRSICQQLLGFDAIVDPEERRRVLAEHLAGLPGADEAAPLLNAVLDVHLPTTESTRLMTAEARREQTAELVVYLFEKAARTEPLLIVLEDCHWLDSASWHLVEELTKVSQPMLLLLTARPLGDVPPPYKELLERPSTVVLALEGLDRAAARQLASRRLGVDSLPEPVAELLDAKAEGNPLFIEELTYSLRDGGYLSVENGKAQLNVTPERLALLELPDTILGLTMSRLARLTSIEQMTIKVASVVGQSFDAEMLANVHPLHLDGSLIADHLKAFADLDLVRGDGADWRFKHVITLEAAYRQLTVAQRKEIHGRVAEALEQTGVEESAYPLAAHHLEGAEEPQRAVDYWEAAGATAVERGAAPDAIRYYQRVKELAPKAGLSAEVAPQRHAHWLSQLADSHWSMGDLDRAVDLHRQALEVLRHPLPQRRLATVWRMFTDAIKQALFSRSWDGRSPKPGPLRQAARICSQLGQVYYFKSDLTRFVMANLAAINLAERSGDPAMAGLAYSGMGNLAGTLRLHALAGRYFERARLPERLPPFEGQTGTLAAKVRPDLSTRHGITAEMAEAVYLLTGASPAAPRVLEMITDAIARSERLGGHEALGASLAIRGFAHSLYSPLAQVESDLRALVELGRSRKQAQRETWGLTLRVPVLIKLGDPAWALRCSNQAEQVFERADQISRPIHFATRAEALLATGNATGAFEELGRAVDAISPTPIFLYLTAYSSLLDTVLAMGIPTDPNQWRELDRVWKKTMAALGRYAMVLPFARARALLYQGLRLEARGRRAAALRRLRRGLERAEAAGLIWDAARIHDQLALLSETPAERDRHLQAAEQAYATVGGRPAGLMRLAA